MKKNPKITAILLAAGKSERMGFSNKMLLKIKKKPIITHSLDMITKL